MMRLLVMVILLMVTFSVQARQQKTGFTIENRLVQKEVAVYYDGIHLTSYCYYDSVMKPFLFPINTPDGIAVTRGFPLKPVPGERTDHPHHTGLWMNYESVNGLDFWNNSTAIPTANRHRYGTIRHNRVLETFNNKKKAFIKASAVWLDPAGDILLNEITGYHFSIINTALVIDRVTTLSAAEKEVVFKDVKDGFLGLRVARELELPSQQADLFVDAQGNITPVAAVNNEGVSGNYLTSEGLRDDSAWGTKGHWTLLTGIKDKKNISIGIVDHPKNTGYPSYRHARGYGLFAINPLGRKVFSNGKEELNFVLKPGEETTFRYRMVIKSGTFLSPKQMEAFFDFFRKMR